MSLIEQILPGGISKPQARESQSIQKKYQAQEKPSYNSMVAKDEASLSESARILAKAYQALGDTAEVRQDVVEAFRNQIQSGEYEIPYNQLASVMAKKFSLSF